MYSGELEFQAKRKTISILQEETNKILNLSRELALMTDAIFEGNKTRIIESFGKMSIIENDIAILRKQITRRTRQINPSVPSVMRY